MRKKKRIVALVLTLLLTCSMNAQAGFTPRYDVDMPEIPDIIEVEPYWNVNLDIDHV